MDNPDIMLAAKERERKNIKFLVSAMKHIDLPKILNDSVLRLEFDVKGARRIQLKSYCTNAEELTNRFIDAWYNDTVKEGRTIFTDFTAEEIETLISAIWHGACFIGHGANACYVGLSLLGIFHKLLGDKWEVDMTKAAKGEKYNPNAETAYSFECKANNSEVLPVYIEELGNLFDQLMKSALEMMEEDACTTE